MSLRFAVPFLLAGMLPLAAFQAPAPQPTPAPAHKLTKKEKKAAAAAARATPAAAPASKPAPVPAPVAAPVAHAKPAPAPAASSSALIGNSESKVCHRADCRLATKMSAAHRVSFASAADAQAKGYHACKVCKPF